MDKQTLTNQADKSPNKNLNSVQVLTELKLDASIFTDYYQCSCQIK